MSIFECLLVGHFVGDFLFQTRWMAEQKKDSLVVMCIHSCIYTASLYLFSWAVVPLTFVQIVLIFISHAVIDARVLTDWWLKYISGYRDGGCHLWLQVMNDQVLHLCIIFAVSFLW